MLLRDGEVAAVSQKRFYPPNCCPWPLLLSPDWLTADTPHSHWPPPAHCDWPRGRSWRTAGLWLDSAGRLYHTTPPPISVAPPPVEGLRREEHLYWRHAATTTIVAQDEAQIIRGIREFTINPFKTWITTEAGSKMKKTNPSENQQKKKTSLSFLF